MNHRHIWVIDDDSCIRFIIEDSLTQWGYQTRGFSDGLAALEQLNQSNNPPALIISDVRMPGLDGISLLEHAQRCFPDLPLIITTAYSDLDSTVSAYQQGAFDYLAKPFDLEELRQLVARVMRHNQSTITARQPQARNSETRPPARGIIGDSPAMQTLYRTIGRLAKTRVNVLISGETGTGKELIANALHKHSPATSGPFVALNMAAIPPELAEAELFGHEKGAFTGATQAREGRFTQADKGTLFLDEIGDMPLSLQAKLLRALAEGSYYPIGGQQVRNANARIIAASHRNLAQLVETGEFREDLYHRLNVIHLSLPPLRERGKDILELLEFHLEKAATAHELPLKKLSEAAKKMLLDYAWPGNIRQLENLCQQLTIMSPLEVIEIEDLPPLMNKNAPKAQKNTATNSDEDWESQLSADVAQALSSGQNSLYQHFLERFDRVLIKTALQRREHHKQQAARALGIGRNTLTRKLKTQNG